MKSFECYKEHEKHEKPAANSFSDEESRRAAEKAMSLLLHKDRTRHELIQRLYQAGFSEAASEEAIQYVEQFGYINDQRYVENYIMFQQSRRSRKEMLHKLAEKGIDRELVCQVMEETGYHGEEDAIETLVLKRLKGRMISELSYEERQKIMAYLGRKGYDFHTIKKAFSQLDNKRKKV